jgi:pSer/pThr/pTyr-binding forkhead associated (FHA) protein
VTTCAHCGRQNDPGSRFCMDCGKPLTASAVTGNASPDPAPGIPATRVYPSGPAPAPGAAAQCRACGRDLEPSLPYCTHCGAKVEGPSVQTPACQRCGTSIADPAFKFCPNCAAPLGKGDGAVPAREMTAAFSPMKAAAPPVQLVLVAEDGTKGNKYALAGEETTVGRSGADIVFADDTYLSPLHAVFVWKDGNLLVRDLGSRNGTWIFLTGPHKLVDGDLILVGSQVLRFRRLGYPGPHPPEADATRRMGSVVPSADIASLAQLRADGSARDTFHLSPGRNVALGRDKGDWVFPYDPSMSGSHATVKSEDADFVLADAGSRNGVAVAVRGDQTLFKGSKVLVGDKLLTVEMT